MSRKEYSYAKEGNYSYFGEYEGGVVEGIGTGVDWNKLSRYISPLETALLSGSSTYISDIFTSVEGIPIYAMDGTVSAPGYGWQNERTTVRYRIGSNNIGESIAGVLKYDWNATRMKLASGFSLDITDMTSGSVLFAGTGGRVSQNNASFFWDNTNFILKFADTNAIQFASSIEPFRLVTGTYTSFATSDPTIAIGYNVTAPIAQASNKITAGVAEHDIELEANWNPSGTYTQVEFTHNYWSPDGTTYRRGFLMHIRNDTYVIDWNWYGTSYKWWDDTGATLLMSMGAGVLNLPGAGANFNLGTPAVTFLTDASSNLTISSATGAAVTTVLEPTYATTSAGQFRVHSDVTFAAGEGGAIGLGGRYTGSARTNFVYIKGAKENGTDGDFAGYLSFFTRPNGGSFTEAMRITSAQLVGINTTGPDRRLDVLDASNPQLRLTRTDGTVYQEFQVDSSGNMTITPTGTLWNFTRSASGSTLQQEILNSNNASGTANAEFLAAVGGPSGGDPMMHWLVSGATGWVMGIDNSDSDAMKLSASGAIGTSDTLRIPTTGAFQIVNTRANGQNLSIESVTELTTIAAAATTDTAIQIPVDAIVLGVTVRVTVVIPTAATFTVTGTTSGTQFDVAGGVSVAANTTDVGTRNCPYKNGAAQTIRITPNLAPAANTGRVRVTIHYMKPTVPTS